MFLYMTPDGRRWLFSHQPIGVSNSLYDALNRHLPTFRLSWQEHSELWGGTIGSVILDELVRAVVERLGERGADVDADAVVATILSMLTHPGDTHERD